MDRRCGPSGQDGCFHHGWCGHLMDVLCLEPWAKPGRSCESLGGFCWLRLCGQCGGSLLLWCQTSVAQELPLLFPRGDSTGFWSLSYPGSVKKIPCLEESEEQAQPCLCI